MKFDDLDKAMRQYETAHDHCVLPGIYMVARLDGRGFTRITKEVHQFEAPFDERFRDAMLSVVKHLMQADLTLVYGYTQSDEISVLFSLNTEMFGRKLRKLNSILAAEASAKFSLVMNDIGCFDCRISQLPMQQQVVDYFRWRQEDAYRNALNAHCYWMQRKQGIKVKEATQKLMGMSVADKNEFLFQNGINFNDLPAWQKRGSAYYWQPVEKQSVNPKTGEKVTAIRRGLHCDMELPLRDAYDSFIQEILEKGAS